LYSLQQKTLRIQNNDTNEMTLDCLYKNTSHLEVQMSPTVLKPGETIKVPIIFTPQNEVMYKEIIPFDINGLQTVSVEVTGEGTKIKGNQTLLVHSNRLCSGVVE